MLKKIQERIFPFLIATSALSVSASAAFYSVSGLSKLFAGASLAVVIMATTLEAAKLVIASLLYQYRKTLPRSLKIYLTGAAAVLVLITSMGIYGFLSSAYQETANKSGYMEKEIAVLELKKDRFEENRESLLLEKSSLDESVASLREGLANNKIQYRDKETGQIITTTSSSTRRSLEKQLSTATENREKINLKLEAVTDSITKIDLEVLDLETGNDLAGELGPLKYISGLTGLPMDRVINYLLLAIIFVFDPLAISLVIAANFAFEKLAEKRPKKEVKEEIIKKPKSKSTSHVWPGAGELFEIEDDDDEWDLIDELEITTNDGMWSEEEIKDFNSQFNADDLLPDEWNEDDPNQLEINFNVPPQVKEEPIIEEPLEEVIEENFYGENITHLPEIEEEKEEIIEEVIEEEPEEEKFIIIPELTPENQKKVDDWDYQPEKIELKETKKLSTEKTQEEVQKVVQTSPEVLKLLKDKELRIESSSLPPIKITPKTEDITEKDWVDREKRKIHKQKLRDNYGYIPGNRGNTGILTQNI